MNQKNIIVILTVLILALCAGIARAENNQTLVAGAGVGSFKFSGGDDVRSSRSSAPMGQLYVEWYALEELGFGLRFIRVRDLNVTPVPVAAPIATDLTVDSTLLTVNWIPIGADSYARLGLLAGVGRSEYEFTAQIFGVEQNFSAEGSSTLLGVFFDWGGEGFGARLGVSSISTDLDDANGSNLDGSGMGYYLDLRWAFD